MRDSVVIFNAFAHFQPLNMSKFENVKEAIKKNQKQPKKSSQHYQYNKIQAPLATPEQIEIGDYAQVAVSSKLILKILKKKARSVCNTVKIEHLFSFLHLEIWGTSSIYVQNLYVDLFYFRHSWNQVLKILKLRMSVPENTRDFV